MIARASALLDAYGRPMASPSAKARKELVDAWNQAQLAKKRSRIEATYDAARDSDEFKNYWVNADRYDADSANSRHVRAKLVANSRYEIANNGYADGIAQTYANDLVGTGPALRMETGSIGFNQLVEFWWKLWCKATQYRRKLWCMAHAKHGDGEAFGVLRTNPGVNNPVKLDVVLYETEQCQTPMLPYEPGYIDGIKFDQFGNPEYYDILHNHPGGQMPLMGSTLVPEQVPARYVLHWFKLRRPGQHRAVPECASTLNCGAAARRWREATLGKAETQADFTLFLKTMFQPGELDSIAPMSTLEIQKRMMTALPNSVEPFQLENNSPGSTYESFHKSNLNEQARPKNMPYNKAACDSSSYNYASGRLDHQTYYGSLDVDREDGNDLALDKTFDLWFDEAVRVFGWLGGNPAALSPAAKAHSWDWPKHQAADVTSEANANKTKLGDGELSLTQLYAANGEDFADALPQLANDWFGDDAESGLTQVERNQKMREILRTCTFNAQNQLASMQQAATQAEQAGAPANAA